MIPVNMNMDNMQKVVFISPFLGSGSKGVNDLCFHTCEEFSPSSSSRLGSGPPGQDLGLEVRIWALRLGLGPCDWGLGL